MKVLLIFPPKGFTSKDPLPSLGLFYLASYLRRENIEVEVIDAAVEKMSLGALSRGIKDSGADIIGITCLTEFRFEAFAAAAAAKKTSPRSWVVLGGAHPTFTSGDILRAVPAIDMVVRGEGELILRGLCEAKDGRERLENIPGITYRNGDSVVENPDAPLIQDLDALPFPARDLIPLKKYNFRLWVPEKGWRRAAHLITSRGCPFGCSFCITSQMSGRKWRFRSPDNILEELERILATEKLNTVWFYDDTFTMNKDRVREICEKIIRRGLNIDFTCSVRVDTVDRDLLRIMKEAGCFKVFFGVESASSRILNEVCGKKITPEQIRTAAGWMDELGIVKNPSYIIGFPDETMTEARETMRLMEEIGGQASLSFLRIYPGTKIEQTAKEKNILPPDFSWSDRGIKKTSAFGAAHGQAPLFLDKLTWAELTELGAQWALENRISVWRRVPQAIRGIRSFADLRHILSTGMIFLKKTMAKKKKRRGF